MTTLQTKSNWKRIMPGLSFQEAKDKIIVGIGTFIIAWLAYLTMLYFQMPTRTDMLQAIENGPYTRDRGLITRRIEVIENTTTKMSDKVDNLGESIGGLKMSFGEALSGLKISIERLQVMQQIEKYNREREEGRSKFGLSPRE